MSRTGAGRIIGICRNPYEPFFWDAARVGEPCPDCDCLDWGHDYYTLARRYPRRASATEGDDDE